MAFLCSNVDGLQLQQQQYISNLIRLQFDDKRYQTSSTNLDLRPWGSTKAVPAFTTKTREQHVSTFVAGTPFVSVCSGPNHAECSFRLPLARRHQVQAHPGSRAYNVLFAYTGSLQSKCQSNVQWETKIQKIKYPAEIYIAPVMAKCTMFCVLYMHEVRIEHDPLNVGCRLRACVESVREHATF